MAIDPAWAGIEELTGLARKGGLSLLEMSGQLLKRIHRINPQVNALLQINPRLEAEARRLERRLAEGREPGLLFGVPFSVKDLILTAAMPTTAGSRVFDAGLTSRRDAPIVRRLRRAGALLLGKAHLHEFAYGVTNDNEHYGPARNPWDRERMTGGSSGGSAASVAAGLGTFSIGTDTRGSIRIPSACCGVCGLKPSRGLLPTRGVLPLSWSLDHVGPIARSVSDLAMVLAALVPRRRTRYLQAVRGDPTPLRLAWFPSWFEALDPQVEKILEQALDFFRRWSSPLLEFPFPEEDEGLEASDVIASVEAVTYHDSFLKSRPQGYGEAVRSRLERGYTFSGMQYVQARRVQRMVERRFRRLFREADCLLAPTLPVSAPPLGTTEVEVGGRREAIVQAFVRNNALQNLAGVPALSLPAGRDKGGLPVGLQLIAPRGWEERLLALGSFFEREVFRIAQFPSGWANVG